VPLINVVFLLLIFFMLTGTLRAPPPLDVQLPVEPPREQDPSSHAPSMPDDERPVLILSATGELAFEGRIVPIAALAASFAQQSTRALSLHADARVPARLLLPLLEAFDEAGALQVDLVTDRAP
jgi:biopolymer transport protein ExbD